MRKMRKILGVALVAAMVLTMNLSVFAAGSKEVSGAGVGLNKAVDSNGKEVKVTFDDVAQDVKNEITSKETLTELKGADFAETMKIVDVIDVTSEVLPVTITFDVAGVKADTKVAVFHKNHSGAWEEIASKAGNGTVTATFTELSPVAIAVPKTLGQGNGTTTGTGNNANGTGAPTAPKTGEMSMVTVAALVAVVAAAGVVTFRKRETR